MSEIRDLIRKITDNQNQLYSSRCFIRDVYEDTNTCTVEVIDNFSDFIESEPNEDNLIYDVKYSASHLKSSNTPAENSYAYVTFFNDTDSFISLNSEISKVTITDSTGNTIDLKAGKDVDTGEVGLYISSNETTSNHVVTRGIRYSGNGKTASIDYGKDWSRSGEGSIVLLDKNVNITASHNGKISIVKKINNLNNPKANSVTILNDDVNAQSYLSLLELDRRIINILYNGSTGGKPALYTTMFNDFEESDAEFIPDYQALFNDLKSYYTFTGSNYIAETTIKHQIQICNKLKNFSGYTSNIENIDKNTYDEYQELRSIITAKQSEGAPSYLLTYQMHKFVITHQSTVLYMDVFLGLLNVLKSGGSVNYPALINILDNGEALFTGKKNISNLLDYKKAEDVVIDEYVNDTVTISLGGILNDIKSTVESLTNDIKLLASSGTTTPSGPGTLNGLPGFQSAASIRITELNNIANNIDELLV